MTGFELDLPLIWAAIIVLAVIMYVLLDGFDLGVGILFPYLGSDEDRDVAMNSVAPIWDGNETWLVLGGAGLFAAFVIVYGIIFPAGTLYMLRLVQADPEQPGPEEKIWPIHGTPERPLSAADLPTR